MPRMLNRREMLVGSVLIGVAAGLPPVLDAKCAVLRERWPRKDELVGGNDRALIFKTARAMMVKLGNAALVTIDDGGLPRVRSVGTREPEGDDLTTWIITHSVSRKVQQIKARPEVALHYVDDDELSQVTLMGVATLHDDAKTMHAKNFYGAEGTAKWWPGYPKNYVMIAVRPLWLEISAPKTAIKGDRTRWRPAGIKL